MEDHPKNHIEGLSPRFMTDRQMCVLPMVVAPLNSRRLRHALYKQTMENDLNKAKEELKREEEQTAKKMRYTESGGPALNWIPLFTNLSMNDSNSEMKHTGAVLKLNLKKNPPPFSHPKPIELERWMSRFRILKKDQAIQTDPSIEPCPICLREEARRMSVVTRRPERPPSIVDPAPSNSRTKDVAIEAPDRTFYSSDQLTFFRIGNYVYRGWTYRTLDGRIEHVPRIPRGIPIDQLRVEKPLRTPAPY